jgi:hypothetical protein
MRAISFFSTAAAEPRAGRAAIDALFAACVSQLEAASRMVISPAAGQANFKRWLKEQQQKT